MVAILQRAMIGVQLLLLVLLIVGRASHLAHNSSLTIAPRQTLGSAR